MLDNAEDVMHSLEEFSKLKPKVIPRELEDYLGYVAKTGDPVFKWCMVKCLFREKMLSVINDFYEDTLTIELPPCPNVDAFNYDGMKTSLLDRLEAFHGAPFTIQRICELLTNPRKEYNRADKFMRAIEKNILVVSTREPGRYSDLDCDTSQECSINGIREVGDSLDSTFILNDPARGPGPDSSSPGAELSDPLPDANHLNTVERVSPVHDQEVSSDSDDSSLENEHLSVEGSSEKTNGLDNEHMKSFVDEQEGANVSSTDMSLSLEEPGEVHCDEGVGNSVSSSHESVISNQQMTFVASSNLSEVMGSAEGTPVESLEPCLLSDGSLLNEVITEPSNDSTKDTDKNSESIPAIIKSDDLNTPDACDQSVDPLSSATSEPDNESVECDTSQVERNLKNDVCDETANSIEDNNDVNNSVNEQVTSCDTTGASNTLEGGYFDSSQVQNEVSPTSDVQSDLPHPDVQSDNAQSNVIDQSESVNSSAPQEVMACDNSEKLEESVPAETAVSNLDGRDDYFSSSLKEDQPDVTNSVPESQTGDSSLESLPQSNNAESDVAQAELVSSETPHLERLEQPDKSQSVVLEQPDTVCQSTTAVSSEDMVTSEPMAQSDLIAQSSEQPLNECLPNDNEQLITESEAGPMIQTEQVTQMDIPSDPEPICAEPTQSTQQDAIDTEPMEVDE